ncbi:MAG: glycerol-3-phosphate 1-O-acyltransferase PlsY [Deltaproteobacteria bacterium]|nr:glycerol-3-phosphate 1-O-acyltransferase PlsY [Deltaproteobacteria bacterium]
MVEPLHVAVAVLAGYLSGSVPYGLLLARWRRGVDVREVGSGNIGATNVARAAGWRLGALVLLLDALKAAVPAYAVLRLAPGEAWLHAAVGMAAFCGHVFPAWLRFRGGKGVACAVGALVVLVPWAALAGVCAWGPLLWRTRVMSVSSLVGAVVAVGTGLGLAGWGAAPWSYAGLGVAFLLALVWTHRENLQRLRQGRELRA